MTDKVFGVVEGFYRRPYSLSQRLDLIGYLQELRLNTYIYGPKADSFHRKNWQKPYPAQRLKEFERMKRYCEERSIDFIYALSPVRKPNIDDVVQKISTMTATGIVDYSIFFDDIEVPLTAETARLQLSILHALQDFLNDKVKTGSLSFCPTQYRGFKKTAYITYIAQHLRSGIDIFWTGKAVVARSITEKDIARITQILRRPVLIWDNLFANDYIPGTTFRFPYRRRSARIVAKVRGILINPMNNYRDSKPLIHTAAQFFRDPHGYAPRKAWRIALQKHTARP
ncbi:MAG: beta-N-acetylglucosaminidase domain-containing protein [candidate division WOR-3 bacterium]|nr:MAG: beta-N-acetylglucosaminidase domain-containing protein [candidate division WOR-3 bacterium]